MTITQFFRCGSMTMAEFKINQKTENGVIIQENDSYFVCTGHDFYKNINRHYLSEAQVLEFKAFEAAASEAATA